MERAGAMTEIQQEVQTFLLTLASRIDKTKGLMILVIEEDDSVMQHISHFEKEIPWLKVVGNLESLKIQVLTERVGFSSLNLDGSSKEDDDSD